MQTIIFNKTKVETVKNVGVINSEDHGKSSLIYMSDTNIQSRLPSIECDLYIFRVDQYKFLGQNILYYKDGAGKWITLKELARVTGRHSQTIRDFFSRTGGMVRVGIYDNGSHGGRPSADIRLAHVRQNLIPLELGLHYIKTRPELKS